MKTILLPVEPNSAMAAGFAVADLVARRFGSHVDGVALKPSIVDFIAPDPVVVVLPQPQYSETELTDASRELFDTFSADRARTVDASDQTSGRFRWSGRPAIDDGALAWLSRAYDVTIVGRPGLGRSEPRMTSLESALFESGRPLLMAPPTSPATIGTNIVIHWNASTEASRVIHDGMPFLTQAERVTLVSVEGNMSPGLKAADMIGYFEMHGIKATETHVKPSGRTGAGEALLAEATRLGADLLLKGAYTQSRLRQMIFGGITQHVLQASNIPVMLSH
ncbi:MAG: universal stress protein [Hyphomicrobiaceae bacterium]